MHDTITCPHCKRHLRLPEDYGGQEVQCPSCKEQFRAGTAFTAAPESLRPSGPRARELSWQDETSRKRFPESPRPFERMPQARPVGRRSEPAVGRRFSLPPALIIVLVIVGLAALSGIGVWLLNRPAADYRAPHTR